ncbi:MAG TPA: LLM class flavin-dependent oxidoreductase [Candidatus Limnocylindria bacterium]|nr:LLM class flavin-dependent oxidoreductase [Candidatus Limnocylindria bacterium]
MADPVTLTYGVLINAEYPHHDLMRYARRSEDLGLDALWYADEKFYRETYTGLAACALATSRIALGTGVTEPYTRHPALTALAVASLDELSGGRAVLGYGAGRVGFPQMGIALERPAVRLREAIEVIRRLWAGERFSFRGETITWSDAALQFPTRAGIPIYLAADGPHTLRLAGEVADGVIVAHCASPLILRPKLDFVRQGRAKAGRSSGPVVLARLDVSLSRDPEAAIYQGRLRLARYLWSQYPNIGYLAAHGLALPADLDRRLRAAGPFVRTQERAAFAPFADAIPAELVTPIACAGAPEDVAQQLRKVFGAGADGVMAYLQIPPGETMDSVLDLYAATVSMLKQT